MRGISASAMPRMKSCSRPAGTTCTPVPRPSAPASRVPRRASRSASTSPPPNETESPVSRITSCRIRAAVSASDSLWYSASVPARSRYHSSMLAPSTARRVALEHRPNLFDASASTPCVARARRRLFGHRRSAREIGIADRTPYLRVSYDAEQTTPRLSRVPPTMSKGSRPAPSGSTSRATATKNASASARRMRRGDSTHQAPRSPASSMTRLSRSAA